MTTPLEDFRQSAIAALNDTNISMDRLTEAILLGATTPQTADQYEFLNYRRALRKCASATEPGTLPTKPPHPAGT